MKKFQVFLTREYVVEIEAESEDLAGQYSELYVSGGEDDSKKRIFNDHKFNIIHIRPTLNESSNIQELVD